MLAHTPTPMGTLLAAQPSNLQLLGAGRRAATLRSRVRAVKRFLDWLAVSHAKRYPTDLHDFTGYLQARQSEPSTRGALEGAHKALVFMEEVAGVPSPVKNDDVSTASSDTEGSPRTFSPRSSSKTGTENVLLDARSTGRPHSERHHFAVLPSVRMVDSSAVMGHDALQRPSWPQAQRRASHRQQRWQPS